MTDVILSLLVGLALGQGFRVLVLVPAMLLALLVALGSGLAHADAIWRTALVAGTACAALQVGYLIGLLIRHILVIGREGRSANPVSGSAPSAGRTV
jgi:hypothetical protein